MQLIFFIMDCDDMRSHKNLLQFRRNLLPPSSGWKIEAGNFSKLLLYIFYFYSILIWRNFRLPQRIGPIFLTVEDGTEDVRKRPYRITILLSQKEVFISMQDQQNNCQ